MPLPIMTRDAVRRFEQIIGNAHRKCMRRSMAVDDNPQGIEFFEVGSCIATLAVHAPVANWMHEVYGLRFGEDDEAHLDAVLAFYQEHGSIPRFRVVPDGFHAKFAQKLHDRGLRQFGFHTVLYGRPLPNNEPPAPGVKVRRCESVDDARLAMRTMLEGFIGKPDPAAQVERVRRTWHDEPGFSAYLATLDGEPAGGALLSVDGDTAYMMAGAVKAACRKRGVQTALIQARLHDAADAGCSLVLGGSDFESSSRQNQERAGLRIAYLAALWAPGPGGAS